MKSVSFGKPQVIYPDINKDEQHDLALLLFMYANNIEECPTEKQIEYDNLYPDWVSHYQRLMLSLRSNLYSC
jgi:hypothetical protein